MEERSIGCFFCFLVVPWSYPGRALVVPWSCPGRALVVPWSCPGRVLVVPWSRPTIFPIGKPIDGPAKPSRPRRARRAQRAASAQRARNERGTREVGRSLFAARRVAVCREVGRERLAGMLAVNGCLPRGGSLFAAMRDVNGLRGCWL